MTKLFPSPSSLAKNPNRVVMVNISTWAENKDQLCVLLAGEHEQIKHKSCVMYRHADAPSNSHLENLLGRGKLYLHEHASSELVDNLLAGAACSQFLEYGLKEILKNHQLIP